MTVLLLMALGAADAPSYRRDIAPILAKHCTICHNEPSLDDPETSGGLALDSFERVIGKKGKAILRAGKSAESEILRRLTTADVKNRMPKDEAPLSKVEIDVVRRWIDGGALNGDAPTEATYRRREPGRHAPLHELVVKLDATIPAKAFGQPAAGVLSLAAPLQPLAVMTAVTVSADGSHLASASHRRVVVWNLKTGSVERQFTDPVGAVNGLAFSPNGKTLFLAGGEAGLRGELRVYDLNSGKLDFEVGLSSEVLTGLAVHPDGDRVALCGMDRLVRVYSTRKKAEAWSFRGHSDFVWGVAFSRDGRKLASFSKDKSVKIWDAETGKVEKTLTSHKDEVLAAAFSPDGNSLMSGGKETQVAVTKLGQGGRTTLVGGHSVALQQFTWNAGYDRLASAGADRTIRIWKPNGTTERTLSGAQDVLHACALSPDGKAAFGAGGDGVLYVWSVDAGRIVARLYVGDAGSGVAGPWIAVAGNGAVAMSDELANRAHWIIGTQEVPLDRAPAAFRQADSLVDAFKGSATLKNLIPAASEAPKKPSAKKPVVEPKKLASTERASG